MRWERLLVVATLPCWAVALAGAFGFLPLAGVANLSLHPYYAVAAAAGWLAGNLYVMRRRRLERALRNRLLVAWLLGPPGALFLLRTLAAESVQAAAPLASLYAFGVYGILFAVPVTFDRGD